MNIGKWNIGKFILDVKRGNAEGEMRKEMRKKKCGTGEKRGIKK
jgi:hypothetical protein